jgi:hypothetical protein
MISARLPRPKESHSSSGSDFYRLLLHIQAPRGFQISSFSAGLRFAASPLVDVATNVFAPSQITSSPSTILPSCKDSSCQPQWNCADSNFFLPVLTFQIVSQILLPTITTASGRNSAIFTSRVTAPSSISCLLSPLPLLVGLRHRLVFPIEYNSIKSRVSAGMCFFSVMPEA